ncbi:RTA1-domain-containing protein [Atractiella rhizophila]|nr:RTA1-domain-containing protein [Atractiella rhizophila]
MSSSSATTLTPDQLGQLTSSERDAYCSALAELKPWKQPGYDAKADVCNKYGYVPSVALGAAFLALFIFLTLVHTAFVVGHKRTWNRWWTMLTITAGGILEIVGWVSRVRAHFSLYNDGPFIAQTTTLIIAPVFFSAALYILLGYIIIEVGIEHSLLKPKLYGAIFISCDLISLVLQGTGGGLAASAETLKNRDIGTHIMEAGIVFQLAATSVFAVLALTFRRKAKMAGVFPGRFSKLYYLELALAVGTTMVIIRGIYRTVELAQGWTGYLIEHESYILLDAIPMLILLISLAVMHPFWTFPQRQLKVYDSEKVDDTKSTTF